MLQLRQLFTDWSGKSPVDIQKIPGAGSNRQYYRITDDQRQTVIGVVGTSRDENNAFVYLARHFKKRQLPVPTVLAVSDDGLRYLQQDLGSTALFDALKGGRDAGGRYNLKERELLLRTIRQLPNFQIRGARGLDWSHCYPQPEFDEESVLFDLNYFKYCFLKPTDLEFHELKLEASFRLMAKDLTLEPTDSFMYRDFQARNVMLDSEGRPSFIDFQGGRKGPYYYDLASFLWQASALYSNKLRRELIYEYYQSLKNYMEVPSKRHFVERLSLFVLFRILQVLGAYGFRGYFERKRHFIESIPPAMDNLRELLDTVSFPYSYLVDMLRRLTQLPQFASRVEEPLVRADGYRVASTNVYESHPADGPATFSKYDGKGPLVVRVFSFSYRKGIPEDESGNGGGYVFDCRSTHNPGRYEPYKKLTGLDEPVIRFLEDDGEILTFLDSVYRLADAHVARYIQRGFTSLMFSFGCTGGQHRSVYSAQHLAQHIHQKFGVEVRVTHREQGISQVLERPVSLKPMQAMVFAAGLGTRLKPLTDTMPKALVPIGDKTLLQRTLETLRDAGVGRVVVNVHHFASQVKEFLQHTDTGLDIHVSDETDRLLDTGGGLRKAAPLFNPHAGILVHNVDILSNVNLGELYAQAQTGDATLLVSRRKTTRYLLFNDEMRLVGWVNEATGQVRSPFEHLVPDQCHKYAFSGIQVFSPRLFKKMEPWPENFGIIDFYLSICDQCVIRGWVQDDLRLMDVGKADTLAQAEDFLHALHKS